MAEKVQAILDQMVVPCHDWQNRGIFTANEIHQIIHRRRNSEYDLNRRQVRKADFLRYITAEAQLERLRALRTKAWQTRIREQFFRDQQKQQKDEQKQQKGEQQAQKPQPKTSRLYGFVGDKHVIQHIHNIWTRTLRKFRADVALYLEYAEFCKTHHAMNRLSSLYAEALQFHPNEIGLWIEASSHEFFYYSNNNTSSGASGSSTGGGIANARILLQRAIRLHPTSQELWLQLFTLELHFIQKMQGRQQILLLRGGTGTGAGADKKKKTTTTTTTTDTNENDDSENEKEEEEDVFQICRIVYKNAMAAVVSANKDNNDKNNNKQTTNVVTFSCRFWDACRLFPATQSLQKWIVDYSIIPKNNNNNNASSSSSSSSSDPQAWMAWALYVWDVEQKQQQQKQQQKQQKPKSMAAAATAAAVDDHNKNEEEENDNNEDDEKEEEVEEEEEEEDQVSCEPHRKKPRCSHQDDDDDEKDNHDDDDDDDDDKTTSPHDVVSILDLAIHSLPTPEMYLKAIRMMLRYVEYLYIQQQQQQQRHQEEEEASAKDSSNKDNNNNNNLVRATRWVATTFQKAAAIDKMASNNSNNNHNRLYTSDMVLEHVDFLKRTTDSSTYAIQVLQDFIQDNNNSNNNQGMTTTTTTNNNIHAKVWVRLATLLYYNEPPKEQQQQQQQHDDDGKHNANQRNGREEEKEEEKMRQGPVAAIEILKQALQNIPMTRKEHLGMMLHLFGAKLELAAMTTASNQKGSGTSHVDEAELFSLFQRILLLAPGFVSGWQGGISMAISNSSSSGDKDNVDKDDDMMVITGKPAFGVGSVTDACLLYFQHAYQYHDDDGMQTVRKVYRAVLYESSILNTILHSATTRPHQQRHDDDDEQAKVAAFVEQVIQMEREASTISSKASRVNGRRGNKENNRHLHRLYDTASKLFGKSALGDQFRQQRNEDLLYGGSLETMDTSTSAFTPTIPHFDASLKGFSPNDFISAFSKYQVVHVSNIAALQQQSHYHDHQKECQRKQSCFSWKKIAALFERLDEKDKASWCIETPSMTKKDDKTVVSCSTSTPSDFLQPRITNDRGYCSFLVQKDQEAHQDMLQCLPVCDLPSGSNSSDGDDDDAVVWQYNDALWFFFGRNNNKNVTSEESASLKGRPEHTDSISTDGTWHYQLAGKKTWCLRPTGALLKRMKQHLSLNEANSWTTSTRVSVECRKGDVIVINTSLWFHATNIPVQSSPSVSYARDFYLGRPSNVGAATSQKGNSSSCLGMTMTNLDGLYANCDIEEATVIFRESDMPDCELHRSSMDPNCEVVELEDGTSAVISTRPIAAGEFFSVAESSSSEEEKEEEDEVDEDDDDED